MRSFKMIAPLAILLLPVTLPAQPNAPVPQRNPVPLPYVREADVMWSKRVWQVIDLREKMNQTLYYPLTPLSSRKSLFDVIREGVLSKEGTGPAIAAYSAAGSEFAIKDSSTETTFKDKLSQEEIRKIFIHTDTVDLPDPLHPERSVPTAIKNELSAADVRQYWIQEEWFFDKERSVLDVRIRGIMPVIEKKNDKGDAIGMAATFWIYFPDLRPLLVRNNAFNRKNDAQLLTFDDLFIKRMFSCYIIKEDNPADRMIADYKGANTLEALLESESIKNGIFIKESDLWQR